MALRIRGQKCLLCSKTLDVDGPNFATPHMLFENDRSGLAGYTDGAWHWDCYERWEHQREFARLVTSAYARPAHESWVIKRQPGRFLLTMRLTVEAEVRVIPEATGDVISVQLSDWSRWLDDTVQGRGQRQHRLADAAIAEVARELSTVASDEDKLLRLFGAEAFERHRLIRVATQRLCPELPALLDRCCASGLRPNPRLEDDNRRLEVGLHYLSGNGTQPVPRTGPHAYDETSVIWTTGGRWYLQNDGFEPYYAPRVLCFEHDSPGAALDAAISFHNAAPVVIDGLAVPMHHHPGWTESSVSACWATATPIPASDLEAMREEQYRSWSAAGQPIVGAGGERYVSIALRPAVGLLAGCLMRLDRKDAWRLTSGS